MEAMTAHPFSKFLELLNAKAPQLRKVQPEYAEQLVAYSALVFFGNLLSAPKKEDMVSRLPGFLSPPAMPLTFNELKQERIEAVATLSNYAFKSSVFDRLTEEAVQFHKSNATEFAITESTQALLLGDAYLMLAQLGEGDEVDMRKGFRIDSAAVTMWAALEVLRSHPDFVETNVKQNILGLIYGIGTGGIQSLAEF